MWETRLNAPIWTRLNDFEARFNIRKSVLDFSYSLFSSGRSHFPQQTGDIAVFYLRRLFLGSVVGSLSSPTQNKRNNYMRARCLINCECALGSSQKLSVRARWETNPKVTKKYSRRPSNNHCAHWRPGLISVARIGYLDWFPLLAGNFTNWTTRRTWGCTVEKAWGLPGYRRARYAPQNQVCTRTPHSPSEALNKSCSNRGHVFWDPFVPAA